MDVKHLDARITVTDFLCSFVKDKSVLDVGCVAHTAEEEASEFWVHRHLVKHAKTVLGVDILREDIEELRSRGYNMVFANAMSDSLGQTFEVIVLGEIIEHVVDPGKLLVNMRRHLKDDGVLLLTTPHPFYLEIRCSRCSRRSAPVGTGTTLPGIVRSPCVACCESPGLTWRVATTPPEAGSSGAF